MRRRLPGDIRAALDQHAGLLTVTAAADFGITRSRLANCARNGSLYRAASGVYAVPRELTPWQRHTLHSRAFSLANPHVYLTGWSAAATHGLPTLGRPPGKVLAVNPRSLGGSQTTRFGKVLHHRLPPEHQAHLGYNAVSIAWTVCDLATRSPLHYALAVADAAARRSLHPQGAQQHFVNWRGAGRVGWVCENADPLAESPIESLGRFAAIMGGLPLPISNAWVGPGFPLYRVDGLWPYHWAAFEADGAIKYDNRGDASRIVQKQTEREWQLRRDLGVDVLRFGYRQALDPNSLAARMHRFLECNPRRSAPIRWWKHSEGVGPVEPEPADWPSPEPREYALPRNWAQPA
ncbi:type IV toxin-antitoxin system AbiEi family antitoxin domain-containing protein [Hoyosella sp. YIM 151337]|uniref:type IV toxin-antitoxin system AbiEi family antitoxin domain-containing protein n=1 Tax=Hoyosella sp. YIM 151337 TaxID=2992742 RepID=UPI0022367769|nr:type IV toxin-antitoxin system AbiEi family antitoxin domain-containing protein [Hoyosella sp. YIM 151337]MCW4352398.1 type IV toxin-antitoxin system AbiEi family antitoxin domain-containing protein [Hoyosella sp. YIM 151337]